MTDAQAAAGQADHSRPIRAGHGGERTCRPAITIGRHARGGHLVGGSVTGDSANGSSGGGVYDLGQVSLHGSSTVSGNSPDDIFG